MQNFYSSCRSARADCLVKTDGPRKGPFGIKVTIDWVILPVWYFDDNVGGNNENGMHDFVGWLISYCGFGKTCAF